MNATDLLEAQLTGVNRLLVAAVGKIDQSYWARSVAPGTNLPGFVLWHAVRTIDWIVQTGIRGIPEVVGRAPWKARTGLATPGIGAGFTQQTANQVAASVSPSDVLEYLAAVHEETVVWLRTLSDPDLDSIPDLVGHQAMYPEYSDPEFIDEISHLPGKPIWRLLAGPAIGHVRGHLGEMDLLIELAGSTPR